MSLNGRQSLPVRRPMSLETERSMIAGGANLVARLVCLVVE